MPSMTERMRCIRVLPRRRRADADMLPARCVRMDKRDVLAPETEPRARPEDSCCRGVSWPTSCTWMVCRCRLMGMAQTRGSFFRALGLKNALLRLMPFDRSVVWDSTSRPKRRERSEKRHVFKYSAEKWLASCLY